MTGLSLFSGIGGLDLAFEWAGGTVTAMCEINPFCRKVLRKHWPDVPLFGDVREVRGEDILSCIRDPKYDEAVAMYELGMSVREVADYFNITHQAMYKILVRRTKLRSQRQLGERNVFYRGGKHSSDKAHTIVEKAINRGVLKNPHICEQCGANYNFSDGRSGIQAHHDDYNFPLKVRWLCQKCHFEWHKNYVAKEVITNAESFAKQPIDIIYGGFP